MGKPIISGIQQMGVGVSNIEKAFKWYRQNFGIDIPVIDEEATAELMLPYTGGQPRKRRAIIAINSQGGGGLEIWQYTSRTPVGPDFEPQLGDLGIYILKIKSFDAQAAFDLLKNKK